MQCTYSHWASIVYHPIFKISNSHSKFSAAPTKTYTRRSSDYNGEDDGSAYAEIPVPSQKLITSTANPFVKHCLKLRQNSSYRRSHGSVLVVGATPIRRFKLCMPYSMELVYREIYRFQESLPEKTVGMDCLILPDGVEIPKGLDESSACIVRVSSMVMKKISGLQSTESIDAIALMKIPTSFFSLEGKQNEANCRTWFQYPRRVLVLDRIQDPGNLGTLLRSAVAFRWDGVFLLPGCCDPFNEKVLRASRGASFQLRIVSGSWIHLEALKNEFEMKLLAGHPKCNEEKKQVWCLLQSFADSLSGIPLCLVLGSEGSGLSEKSQQACELVSIPMAGEFESLNVSVAGGIFLYMLQPKNTRVL